MAVSRADACSLEDLLQLSTPSVQRSTSTPSSSAAQLPTNLSRADAVDLMDLLVESDKAIGIGEPLQGVRAEDGALDSAKRIHMQLASDSSSDSEFSSGEEECDRGKRHAPGQLWNNSIFPAGITRESVADMLNLKAAQAWRCPCQREVSCLDASRIDITQLYQHRVDFINRATAGDGRRETMRYDLQSHYDRVASAFTQSFRVGPRADLCPASYGVACGVSFMTFARARADVTLERPGRAARKSARTTATHEGVQQVQGYIRSLTRYLEGSKGGTYAHGQTKFFTAAKAMKRRYADYVAQMNRDRTVVKCRTVKAFAAVWSADKRIVEVNPTGHAICDCCADLDAQELALGTRNDPTDDMVLVASVQVQRVCVCLFDGWTTACYVPRRWVDGVPAK